MSPLQSFVFASAVLLPSVLAYGIPASSSSVSAVRGGAWPTSSAIPYDDPDEWQCDDEDEADGYDHESWSQSAAATYTTTTVEYTPCTAGQTITRGGSSWVAPAATTVSVTKTITVTRGAGSAGASAAAAWNRGSSGSSASGSWGGLGKPSGAASGGSGAQASGSRPAGSSPSQASSSGSCAYYLEDIKHQGIAAFNSNPGSYVVFRDVKAFGAKGDGVTDDTEAINAAISSGNRCGPVNCGPGTSTTSPALVYFPPGTYVISAPIIDYYYTQIIGNPNCMPVIKPTADFNGSYVIDGNPYQPSGNTAWGSTNVFWRQVRNFIFDFSSVPGSTGLTGVHWPTGQATSLQNIQFKMAAGSGSKHVGVFIESGSGGFMGDLTFTGGLYGLQVGNQQFTMRNLKFDGCQTAIYQIWDWGWTYKSLSINNCQVGISMGGVSSSTGLLNVGSVVVADSVFSNTPVGIATNRSSTDPTPVDGQAANSLILDNVQFNSVAQPVTGPGDVTVLNSNANTWGQGHKYTPNGPQVFQGTFSSHGRPVQYVEKSKPQYETVAASGFLSARTAGAKGDGKTDDTAALNAAIWQAVNGGLILFLDHGDYLVTDTIYFPPGLKIVGESYSVILSSGAKFSDISNPLPVVQIGKAGESGSIEMSDIIVSTAIINGVSQGGAILIEYNLATTAGSGLWDVHTRVGGFAGSNLQVAQCLKQPGSATVNQQCIAAFMSLHITKSASGFYGENNWFWVADHDVEDPNNTQITVYAGRGLLVESQAGDNILYGSAVEHHVLYQYGLIGTKNFVAGQIQTETAYYQPLPAAPQPFPIDATYNDPTVGSDGWGLYIKDSTGVNILGAGLYSFFNNYDVHCSDQGNTNKCQSQIFNVINSDVEIYNLNTVGTQSMAAVNGQSVAEWSDNRDGFVSTIALFQISA